MEDDITVNDDLEGYVKDDLEGDDLVIDDERTHMSTAVIDDERTHMSTAVIDDERTHMSTAVRVMNGGHTAQITDEMMKIRPVVQPTEGAQRALVHTDGASTPVGKTICGTGGELTPVIPLSQYMIDHSPMIAQMRKGKQYEAMSEEHTLNCLEEKLAIPEGGVEERMDVSECFEDADNDVDGYVSVNVKGQGRPIYIRSGDKFSEALSPLIEEKRTVAALPDVLNRPASQAEIESVEELQNKKTGNTQTLELSTTDTFYPRSIDQADLQGNYIQEKTVAQKKDAENDYPSIDNDETSVHADSGFQSPAKVVSTDNDETSVHADLGFQSPAKVVSIGHLIESPCKKKYKTVLARKKIGTKKSGHGKEGTGLKLVNRERPYPKLIENIHVNIDGSKHHVHISFVPVEDGADTQQGQQRDGIAEHDKKQTICDGSVDRPPESSLGIGQECGSTLMTYPDTTSFDSISAVERSISDTGENTIDRPLDLTVKSVGRNMRPSANQYEAVSNDRNLPGLSTLSLESSDQRGTASVAVEREVSQILSGQEHIVDLYAGGHVSAEQLVKLYYNNPKMAAVKQLSTLTPAVERYLQEYVQARSCQDPVSPSNRTTEPEQNIPALAIPNLQYLGLANEDGCIKESKTEQVKNKLKEKLEGKRKS